MATKKSFELTFHFIVPMSTLGHGDYAGVWHLATFSTAKKAREYLDKYRLRLSKKYGGHDFRVDKIKTVPHDPERMV